MALILLFGLLDRCTLINYNHVDYVAVNLSCSLGCSFGFIEERVDIAVTVFVALDEVHFDILMGSNAIPKTDKYLPSSPGMALSVGDSIL